MTSLLPDPDLDRHLAALPGVCRGAAGTLVLAIEAPSFPAAVRLIDQVATAAEDLNHHPDVDLRWRTVTFTLSTHSAGGITALDVELARHILTAAAELGARSLPAPERVEIALDCVDADSVRPFWRAVLGYTEHRAGDAADTAELHDPAGRGPVLWFQAMDPPRTGRGRFHLDVYLPADQVSSRLEACLAAGGHLVSDAHSPSWWIVADAEGNEACLCTA